MAEGNLPILLAMELEYRPPKSTGSGGQTPCSVLIRLCPGVRADKAWKVTSKGLHTPKGMSVPWGTEKLNGLPTAASLGIKGVCFGLGLSDPNSFSASCLYSDQKPARYLSPVEVQDIRVKKQSLETVGWSNLALSLSRAHLRERRVQRARGTFLRLVGSGELRCGEGSPEAENLASIPRCSGSLAQR